MKRYTGAFHRGCQRTGHLGIEERQENAMAID